MPSPRRAGRRRRTSYAGTAAGVVGTHLLLATGRQPNTDDLGLDAAGVATDERGYIVVDNRLRTNVPGIWALGDCNGKGAFTHTAYNDYEIVAANLLDDEPRRVTDRIMAYALYIDPPLGRAGMTRTKRKTGRPPGRHAPDDTRRPRHREGRDPGFMKVVVDAETGRSSAPPSSAPAATKSSTPSWTS